MILIGRYDSPFVRRVAVALNFYGIAFERRLTSVFRDFDELLAVNPLGKVPVLELDDGELLFDSRAILDYLDTLMPPAMRLTPAEQPERRRVQRIDSIALGVLEKCVELRTETVRKQAAARDEAWIGRVKRQIASGLTWLENQRPEPWFGGDGPTQADITVALTVTTLREKIPEFISPDHALLSAHCDCCEDLPALRAAAYSRDEAI